MKYDATARRTKQLWSFIATLAVTAGITLLLTLALSGKFSTAEKNVLPANIVLQQQKILATHSLLQAQYASLQRMDEQFAVLLNDTAAAAQCNDLHKAILLEENRFTAIIESMNKTLGVWQDEKTAEQFATMLAAYRSIINSRYAVTNLRNIALLHQGVYTADESALLNLQEELLEKNNYIVTLETRLIQATASLPAITYTASNSPNAYMENISVLENKLADINRQNSTLKKDNDLLQQALAEANKNYETTRQEWKEKNAAVTDLQKNIQELNAALLLARVDCNLSRADAAQVVYTAKQRRQLLTEASGILSDLANSPNSSSTKKQVNDKIVLLNKVAANFKE
ncbi:MAG TPA: hypothetical protein PKC39_12380 [Ferruginibacter sp.]|nr:hypothetical protein [Ferruginibacter sp.]HMP21747.1 hypothetical protein [Ferruginibacter sp.]